MADLEAGGALLDRLRGLLAVRELLDAAIGAAVRDCEAARVDRTTVAAVLGVHRSTLYRRYPVSAGGAVKGRPEAAAERPLTVPVSYPDSMDEEAAEPAPASRGPGRAHDE